MTAPTPPAPTLAPGRVSVPDPLDVALALDSMADTVAAVLGCQSNETREAHRLASLLRAPNQVDTLTATPAAPVAGTFEASFIEAADVYEQTAFDHGAEYGADMSSERRRDDTAEEVRAARAALIAAHAAAVADAWTAGYVAPPRGADAAAEAEALAIALDDARDGARTGVVSAMVADDRLAAAYGRGDAAGYARAMRECSIAEMVDAGFTEADAAEDVDARMARAATTPALVNGGPPTDGLDDGR